MIHLYTIAQERASRLSRLLERRSESSLLLVSRQHQTSFFGEIDWGAGDLLHCIFQFLTGGTQIADLFTENLTVSYCMVFKMFRDRDEVGVWNPLKKIDTDTIKIYQLESHRIFVWCNFFLTHKNQILPVFFSADLQPFSDLRSHMVNFCSIWPAMTTWETVNWALFFAARAFCFGWFYWFKVKGSSRFNDMLCADVCRICLAGFAFFCKKWSWFHPHDVVGNLIYSLSLNVN